MRVISSKDNKIIKEAAGLLEKKHRDALGLYLIEGPNQLKEAMEQGGRLRFIFIRAGADAEKLGITGDDRSQGPALFELTGEVFEKLSLTENSQGFIAVAEKCPMSEEIFFSKEGGNIIVLDRVQDPGNVGTLLRTAEAMGFSGALFIKGCADPWAPKVVRAAAGTLMRLPLLFAENDKEALEILSRHGKTPFCAAMDTDCACYMQNLSKNAAVIIGNEGSGASELFKKVSKPVSIPMDGKTESLNAALAGAILMYESLRQRLAPENDERK